MRPEVAFDRTVFRPIESGPLKEHASLFEHATD